MLFSYIYSGRCRKIRKIVVQYSLLFALYISGSEFSTDCEIVGYSNDSTNTSHQSEICKYTKPAVLSFEGIFTNSSKYILYFVDEPSNVLQKLLF